VTAPAIEKTSEKTSTWLALRNPSFRRLWLAMVVSGSCIGAHNTAVYFALHSLGAKIVLISLMATVSALPATLFTLPAGAIADMVDRKKILVGGSTLARFHRDRSGNFVDGASTESLPHSGKRVPL
jgi:MFS family permease